MVVGEMMFTVKAIEGDYAVLVSDAGNERQTALFLLPEGLDVGTRLRYKDFEWEIV